jgi:hypothetical protein
MPAGTSSARMSTRVPASTAVTSQIIVMVCMYVIRAKSPLRTTGKFSRRLQLAPGLMPPTSWSLSPCIGPEIYWRVESFRSPAVGAIYLMPPASARNFAVMKVRVMCGIEVVRSWVKKRGSRVEWYAVPPAINSGSELLIFVRRAAHSHDPKVGSAQPGPDTRDWPCQTGLSVLQP